MVTGGAGFVGTNLIKRLLKDGHNVVSLDNYSTGTEDNHQEGCKYVDADIRDVIDFSYYMEKPDVIYHLAAIARIQPSFKNPANTLEVGILGTINILEWAREIDCKVIFAGSSSVHSGKLKNPYTFSKVVADDLCLLYKKHFDLDASICRFYNVYGPHQLTEGEYCTVVGIFERQYENGEPLTITGDGLQRRHFTHIDDIVNGLILTMDSIFSPDIIELGRGNNYSINELASMFKTEIEYIDERPGEARETLCDISNAHREIGYEPEVDLEDYISGVIGE